jgi:hypothetical protein
VNQAPNPSRASKLAKSARLNNIEEKMHQSSLVLVVDLSTNETFMVKFYHGN